MALTSHCSLNVMRMIGFKHRLPTSDRPALLRNSPLLPLRSFSSHSSNKYHVKDWFHRFQQSGSKRAGE